MQDVDDAFEEFGVFWKHPNAPADHRQPERCALERVSNQLFSGVRRVPT